MNAASLKSRFPVAVLRTVGAILLALATLTVAAPQPVRAQDDLQGRLRRLETDMQSLTRDFYRGGRPPASGAGTLAPNLATDFELRLTQLQVQIEQLTSRIEETGHQASLLQNQLEKLSADVDQRLLRLEEKAGLSAIAGSEAAGVEAPAIDRPPPAGNPTVLAPPPANAATAAAPAPLAESGTLPTGSVNEQYNYALGLLRQSDYTGAGRAFAAFVKAHPKEPLAGNAQYWLGESYYVSGKYKEAAVAFAEGFQKYPKSDKAKDNLLKLAITLGELGQTADACIALKQLTADYPDIPPTTRQRVTQERSKLKCK